jgi:hypothetical protein
MRRWAEAVLALVVVAGIAVGAALLLGEDDGGTPEAVVFPGDGHDPPITECGKSAEEPREIVLACADFGIVARDLKWNDWGDAVTDATGTAAINDCFPSCAEGSVDDYPIRVILSAIQTCADGQRRYTRLSYELPSGGPPSGASGQSREYLCPRP